MWPEPTRILAVPMSDRRIDLRSDTVTHPTREMRRAMAEAELGDDVFGDDPTVIALEERAAELMGKEAALFAASGTMGNIISVLAHVPRGGELIIGASSHIVAHEAGGHAMIVGASAREIPTRDDGTMDLDAIRAAFRDPSDAHDPITSLVTLENAHAESMGQPLTAAYTSEVAAVAHEQRVPLHVDGARLFNAAVALGVTARDLVRPADSVMFSLSKGLACPVGSVVAGTRDFIRRARRARKVVGGGMRQVGVLAAPGLVALRDGPAGMIERLAEDHENAQRLAAALADMPGIADLDPAHVRTNFVFFRVGAEPGNGRVRADGPDPRAAFLDALAERGVLMIPYSGRRVRAVTHYGIEREDIDRTVDAVRRALRQTPVASKRSVTATAVPAARP
jgi:threonine aldolase